jgi:hypothetical protein
MASVCHSTSTTWVNTNISGVPHLAVVHYERVLSMVQKRMDAEEHDDVKEVSLSLVLGNQADR